MKIQVLFLTGLFLIVGCGDNQEFKQSKRLDVTIGTSVEGSELNATGHSNCTRWARFLNSQGTRGNGKVLKHRVATTAEDRLMIGNTESTKCFLLLRGEVRGRWIPTNESVPFNPNDYGVRVFPGKTDPLAGQCMAEAYYVDLKLNGPKGKACKNANRPQKRAIQSRAGKPIFRSKLGTNQVTLAFAKAQCERYKNQANGYYGRNNYKKEIKRTEALQVVQGRFVKCVFLTKKKNYFRSRNGNVRVKWLTFAKKDDNNIFRLVSNMYHDGSHGVPYQLSRNNGFWINSYGESKELYKEILKGQGL